MYVKLMPQSNKTERLIIWPKITWLDPKRLRGSVFPRLPLYTKEEHDSNTNSGTQFGELFCELIVRSWLVAWFLACITLFQLTTFYNCLNWSISHLGKSVNQWLCLFSIAIKWSIKIGNKFSQSFSRYEKQINIYKTNLLKICNGDINNRYTRYVCTSQQICIIYNTNLLKICYDDINNRCLQIKLNDKLITIVSHTFKHICHYKTLRHDSWKCDSVLTTTSRSPVKRSVSIYHVTGMTAFSSWNRTYRAVIIKSRDYTRQQTVCENLASILWPVLLQKKRSGHGPVLRSPKGMINSLVCPPTSTSFQLIYILGCEDNWTNNMLRNMSFVGTHTTRKYVGRQDTFFWCNFMS